MVRSSLADLRRTDPRQSVVGVQIDGSTGVTLKILIADDHELVRDTMRAFLERESEFAVTVAPDFAEACAAISSGGPFDVIILDYQMPGMAGLESVREAMTLNAGKPVAIVSGAIPRPVVDEALSLGVAGVLPKSIAAASFVNAVRVMASGEQYAPVRKPTKKEAEEVPATAKLSERELQVVRGLLRGQTSREIAEELGLQEGAVDLHVKLVCRKLDARNPSHAGMIARDTGLL